MSALLRVEAVPAAQWPSLAGFIFERNHDGGDVRCLHCNAGADVGALADELRSLSPTQARWCAARIGEALVGVAGAEFDAALGRAWLRGPLVAAGQDYAAVAAALLPALSAMLPAEVIRLDAFVNAGWQEALGMLRHQGFGDESRHDEFLAAPPVPAGALPPGVRLVAPDPRWRAAIGALHESEFRAPYVTSDELFAPEASDRFTRIALLDGAPVGYVRARFDAQWQEGCVDFIAVAPQARGHGVGRALLQAALQWSFGETGAGAVALTMRQDRHAARALYDAVGFRRVRTGVALRRELRR